jgi:hypothetical protein
VKKLKYFSYHPERTNITLIGTDKKQIISTLKHYNLPIPSNKDIRKLARVRIMCAFGYNIPNHYFEAEIMGGVSFEIHANAFDHIRKIAENFDGLKRGDLYKFDTGRREYGLLFLPKHMMQGIKGYDWNQHKEQVDKWMAGERNASSEEVATSKFLVEPD